MAKLFTGKLPSDHREVTIVEIEGGETIRSTDAGLNRRQVLAMRALRRLPVGTRYTVRNVIVDGIRGPVVRELRVLTDGQTFAAGEIPTDYR